jgi:hypothetical protein
MTPVYLGKQRILIGEMGGRIRNKTACNAQRLKHLIVDNHVVGRSFALAG